LCQQKDRKRGQHNHWTLKRSEICASPRPERFVSY